MRTGVLSTAWTYLTGRSRRRLRKKEKKKIDKVRFFTSPSDARRDARALGRVDAMPVRPSRVRPSRALPSRPLPCRRRAP